MKNKVLVVGAFHEIVELAEECNFEIIGFIDNNINNSYCGYPILSNDAGAILLDQKVKNIPVIITPDLPKVRLKLYEYYFSNGFNFTSFLSPRANYSKSSNLGIGLVVQFGSNISSNVIIGDFVKINTYANVMHDSIIGDFCTIAPNAVILGNVKVGHGCYIGANSTILPNVKICENVIIGAGSVVTKDINIPGSTYVGVPAKKLSN